MSRADHTHGRAEEAHADTAGTELGPDGGALTLVIAAMPEEAASLRRLLCDVRRVPSERALACSGRLGRNALVLAVTGDGERRAREGVSELLELLGGRVRRVLVIGVSGALSSELRVGDLVVAESVRAERGARVLRADPIWVDSVVQSTGARRGVCVSSDRIADSAEAKQRLLALADAGSRVALVDLESDVYAAAAEARAIPWIVLRAVSDGAHEALPALLNRARDEGGAVLRARVICGLLRDPRPLPRLLQLQKRVDRCAALLATAVRSVLDVPPPSAADINSPEALDTAKTLA